MSQFNTFINPLFLFPSLVATCLVYYLISAKYRWMFLLFFSMAFYTWISSWGVIVLLVAILMNYFFAIWIDKSQNSTRSILLTVGILLNLTLLVAFKYGSDKVSPLFIIGSTAGNLIYPLGLSFFTIQNISYLVDVFKKLISPERNIGIFAVYVSFFAKIASGPIERGKNLIAQIHQDHIFDWENVRWGFRQIVFGLFKKLVIADRLALIANEVFDNPSTYNGLSVAIGISCFAFQLYYDFSGYSDLALGIARLFGFKLTINFNLPYLAEDIVDFWNRWHISLSIWLRDYIFYPTRRYFLKNFRNITILAIIIPPLLTMIASGFWHGTGWTFILWGFYHALLYIFVMVRKQYFGIEKLLEKTWLKFPKILLNFIFVSLGWVFFRARSIHDVGIIFDLLLEPNFSLRPFVNSVNRFDMNFVFPVVIIIFAVFFEMLLEYKIKQFDRLPMIIRWGIYCFLLVAISTLGIYQSSGNPFVYFKF